MDELKKEIEKKQAVISNLQKEVETLKSSKDSTTRSDDILKLLEKVRQEHLQYSTSVSGKYANGFILYIIANAR